ncbi:MAG: conserved exported protein of unknown function [Promethearchaeota archaeon]|nr:MAG: conserved exported protein of unknown function [Candidatus Lokiarchaeota archaeon]
MKKKSILIISVLLLGIVFPTAFLTIQPRNQNNPIIPLDNDNEFIKSSASIPEGYSEEINMDGVYVYNISGFGDTWNWYNYDDNRSDNYDIWQKWATGLGGQVFVNFTGFFNRHVNDTPWSPPRFPDENMPYMNIIITKPGGLPNVTRNNCSNSEIANNMNINFFDFDSGILIPSENLSQVKQWANDTATIYNLDFKIEESYHFIKFNFANIYQTTELIYNRLNGLLVYINTTADFGSIYHLEMTLTNFTLEFKEFEEEYCYTVSEYGHGKQLATLWEDLGFNYVDTWTTNQNGTIKVNFTGFYNKDPSDTVYGDVFDNSLTRAWLDIEVYFLGFMGPIQIMSLTNRSNREAAIAMTLGFWNFQSGFLLPQIDNITDLKNKANGTVPPSDLLTIEETELTIKFDYVQASGFQTTDLIYEKRTGLLLRADTECGDYQITMKLDGFSYEEPPESPPSPPNNNFLELLIKLLIYLYLMI